MPNMRGSDANGQLSFAPLLRHNERKKETRLKWFSKSRKVVQVPWELPPELRWWPDNWWPGVWSLGWYSAGQLCICSACVGWLPLLMQHGMQQFYLQEAQSRKRRQGRWLVWAPRPGPLAHDWHLVNLINRCLVCSDQSNQSQASASASELVLTNFETDGAPSAHVKHTIWLPFGIV